MQAAPMPVRIRVFIQRAVYLCEWHSQDFGGALRRGRGPGSAAVGIPCSSVFKR
jgi:hypothetical protein